MCNYFLIYRNMATETMSLMEKCQELAREHWWKVSTSLATLMLACQMSMNTALAADPAQNQAPVAVSAPPTAKGYWQVVTLKDGSKMSFTEIAALPAERKDDILDGLGKIEIKSYQEWRKWMKQVANQRIDDKKWVEQVANQRIDDKKWVEQVANQTEKSIDSRIQVAIAKGLELDNQTLIAMKTLVDAGKSLRTIDKPYLEDLAKWPPSNPIAVYLLERAKFA